MGTLKALLLAALLAWPASAFSASPGRWDAHIAEASARFGIPAEWIRRVMRAESGGRRTLNGRPIVSRAGAMGLMQLMPKTWAEIRARYRLGLDPHDPRDNILAGAAYLRLMYERFGYPGLFAAYNAGPARYARYLAGKGRLPGETAAYLAALTASDGSMPVRARSSAAGPSLFAVHRDGAASSATPVESGEGGAPDGLFALRSGSVPLP